MEQILTEKPPFSLYVHLPWCVRKCPYCDFNSHTRRDSSDERGYVAALLRDLAWHVLAIRDREIKSIFFGGGTPSLFSGVSIAELLDAFGKTLRLATDVEITLEANPGTAEAERFAAYRAAGVNRISLGVQSFDDDKLKALGRIHGAQEAKTAYGLARDAGFENINLDLMFGLPGQDLNGALTDIKTAIQLAPEHISWYQLTLEPNTAFYRQPPVLPDDEQTWVMQEQGQALLANAGYAQYEISAYAKPDRQCRHNRNYWEFGDYLGIGAGAHSKLTDLESEKIERLAKIKNPQQYQNAAGGNSVLESHVLIAEFDLPFEFMLNALRLTEGVPESYFSARTGLPLSVCGAAIATATARGLLECDGQDIRPTVLGARFLNDLLCLFLDDPGIASSASVTAPMRAIAALNLFTSDQVS